MLEEKIEHLAKKRKASVMTLQPVAPDNQPFIAKAPLC
jgi:hypothetical protein